MSKGFIKCTRALTQVSQVIAHVKYVGFRSKELQDKGFFGRDNNYEDYKNFIKRIESNPALKHSKSIKAQKLIFSLKQSDYDAYIRSGKDYKDLVRETLSAYEKKHNVKLDWIANIHNAEGHPHCHVIIKGVSDTKDADGKYTRIRFKKDDFKMMKEVFNKEFEKDVQYELREKFDFDKTINDIGKGFERVMSDIKKDLDKESYKAEKEKQKLIDKEKQKSKDQDKDR